MGIATNIWFWVVFIVFVLGMLSLDLGVFHRKAHVIRPKEAAIWTAVWVSLALAFAAGDCLSSRTNEGRIVYRFFAERAEIFGLVSEFLEQCFDFLFVTKTGVIAAECNLH